MRILLCIAAVLIGLASAEPARAHPHVWVTMKTEVVYGTDGAATGVRHSWSFDDMFSTFATQGLDMKEAGKPTREELAPLAKVNIESLKDFAYFTFVTADGQKREFVDPTGDYWLDFKDSILTLNFTLPLKEPVKAKELKVDLYDSTMFIDFAFAKEAPVGLANAPAGCKFDVVLPREMTTAEARKLGEIPADQPNTVMAWGANFASKILVHCP